MLNNFSLNFQLTFDVLYNNKDLKRSVREKYCKHFDFFKKITI